MTRNQERISEKVLLAQKSTQEARELAARGAVNPAASIPAFFSTTYAPRYQDLNHEYLMRTAEAMTEGHIKHELEQIKAGTLLVHQKNYLLAGVADALDRLGHAIKHLSQLNIYYHYLLAMANGEVPPSLPSDFKREDHLGHVSANLNMLAGMEAAGILPSSYIKSPLLIAQEVLNEKE